MEFVGGWLNVARLIERIGSADRIGDRRAGEERGDKKGAGDDDGEFDRLDGSYFWISMGTSMANETVSGMSAQQVSSPTQIAKMSMQRMPGSAESGFMIVSFHLADHARSGISPQHTIHTALRHTSYSSRCRGWSGP